MAFKMKGWSPFTQKQQSNKADQLTQEQRSKLGPDVSKWVESSVSVNEFLKNRKDKEKIKEQLKKTSFTQKEEKTPMYAKKDKTSMYAKKDKTSMYAKEDKTPMYAKKNPGTFGVVTKADVEKMTDSERQAYGRKIWRGPGTTEEKYKKLRSLDIELKGHDAAY